MRCWAKILIAHVLLILVHIVYAQETTSSNTSTQPPMSEFQAWLQSNGYLQKEEEGGGTLANGTEAPPSEITPPPGSNGKVAVSNHHQGPPKHPLPLTYEQSKQIMINSAPKGPAPTEDERFAFDTLLQQNMPLKPQQVVELRQQIDLAQRAASVPAVVPPKPVSSTIMINLAPGSTPPVIRLAQGYVSSIVFVDSTGSPWPIAQFDIGNPKNVNIQWDGKSNILLMQAIAPYGNGDIVFRLIGLPTPITLELISGQRVVDYRVDIHVPGIGPNAKDIPIGTALPESANSLLLGVLDGVAPAGSRVLTVRGADSQAWLLGERMYLRTRFTVLSPGWISTMVSIDGMHAYELPKTSSVLVSRYGEPYELKVEGF